MPTVTGNGCLVPYWGLSGTRCHAHADIPKTTATVNASFGKQFIPLFDRAHIVDPAPPFDLRTAR
jgi:hypothetical protein